MTFNKTEAPQLLCTKHGLHKSHISPLDVLFIHVACFRYAEEAPDEDESTAPQLVPLTAPAAIGDASKAKGGKPVAASEGTPLLADRIGELAS